MKLIKLEVNNFRQFYGKQVIDFALRHDKNVTLIHGENNGGKTALLNALRWCLYEELTDNLQEPLNLLNKHASEKGENKYSVYVQLLHNGRLLEVQRSRSRSDNASKLRIYEIIEGCYSECPENNPNTLINTLLPKEMSQYFFYQGEGTGTLNSQSNFSHIKEAISKVLGLTVTERTLDHLKKIKNDYQKDLKQYDTNKEIENMLASKDIIQTNLSRDYETCAETKKSLIVAEKEFEKQTSHLARFDKTTLDAQLKLRDQKENFLSDLKRQRLRYIEKRSSSLPKWICTAFETRLASFDLSSVETSDLNKASRFIVDKQLINSILEMKVCICGLDIVEHSEAARLISELGKSAVDPDLKYRWQRASDLHSIIAEKLSPKEQMIRSLSDIDDCDDNIRNVEDDIRELSHSIVESDISDIKIIEHSKNEAKALYDQLSRDIPNLENNILRAEKDLKDIDARILRLTLSQPKALKLRKLIKATDKIIELYESAIRSSKERVDLILLKKMQVLFSRVAFNGYTVKKSSSAANDAFTWVIVDKDNKRVAAGNGYQAMLAISFIIALIQFSKERVNNKHHLLTPGTVAPFIADSILAFIGPDNGRELVRYIAESVEQSIFLFSQAQWTESHSDGGIREKIGKEYNLVQHTVLTKEEFKGQYPTQLSIRGQKFDVVRFGSEFERVTIEEISLHG